MRGAAIIIMLLCVWAITHYINEWRRYWSQDRSLRALEYWQQREQRRRGYEE